MQKDFVPKKIFLENAALDYEQTQELLSKYPNVPVFPIEHHHKIDELRGQPLKKFPTLKQYLIIGVRKSLTYVKNEKTSDYLVPYTSFWVQWYVSLLLFGMQFFSVFLFARICQPAANDG